MAKTTEMVEVSLDSLKPYAKNAKIHGKEQVEKLKASIEEFGFISPCLIDRENNIIAGHGRVQAAKELGMETVPCIYIEGLTEEQRRAYILADNRLSELGEWDMELVHDELDELTAAGFDASLTGFDWDEAAKLDPIEDDYDTEGEEGDIVADIFGGSGTTLIACEQLKRRCRMMELDPHYCDVIIDRWEEFTGGKAVRLDG